jgi:two-component system, sensor histidine kinase
MSIEEGSLVLVIDDNDAARYLAERTLRRAGFRTAEARSGEEGLALARSMLPDLVLLDISLPGISGFEVCRRLRGDPATASIAIVQISATFESPEYQVRGLEGGADTFLVAPVESTVLVATVRAMLRLRRAEAQLREFDRRKDEFLATLAHELRNPLAPLLYCLDTLQHQSGGGEQLDALLPIMRRQTEHLVRLVDDLTDMSRITQNKIGLQIQPASLAEILDMAIEARRSELEERGHTLTVSLPEAPVELHADAVRLTQVFGNLISNSIKFTPPGGEIRVLAEADAVSGHATVSVIDNGEGIAREDLERIFELFVQARQPGSGLGIGLALVNRIVQMHGGQVSASSDGPGRGSTFRVKLPMRAGLVASSESPQQAERVSGVRKRVLVVDDNVDAANAMAGMLRMMDQDVRTSYDGAQALEVAEDFEPHVIFMDITMPGVDGLESMARIRARSWSRGTLICALSGHGRPADLERSAQSGADMHLVKPIDRHTVERVLLEADPDGRETQASGARRTSDFAARR